MPEPHEAVLDHINNHPDDWVVHTLSVFCNDEFLYLVRGKRPEFDDGYDLENVVCRLTNGASRTTQTEKGLYIAIARASINSDVLTDLISRGGDSMLFTFGMDWRKNHLPATYRGKREKKKPTVTSFTGWGGRKITFVTTGIGGRLPGRR